MATMTINTTAAQASRVVTAFGKTYNLRDNDGNPRNATAAEVKAFTIGFLRGVVLNYERDQAAQAAADAVPDIEPS